MTAEPAMALPRAGRPGLSHRTAEQLRQWSASMAIGSACCVAALMAWRRLAGALNRPLDPLLLLSVAALMVVVVAGGRMLWRRLPAEARPRRSVGTVAVLPSSAVLALGAALSLPGTHTGALAVFWALLAGEELWAWQWVIRQRAPRAGNRSRPLRVDPPEEPSPHPALPTLADDVPGGEVLQQLTRSQAADGSEQLTGWLGAPFAAGQRTARVHVAFCPPFPKTPRLTVEQVDGPPTRIKTAQFPYGARLDLKLAEMAAKPDRVLLRFAARSKAEG